MATQGEIDKNIAFFIKHQFPGIYREDGPELVQLVEDYYKFAETQTNQHVYLSRRYFDIKDIDSTLSNMIIFFKKKFLADLPLKEDVIKFIVKNILDLYRRKGTAAGIELFFAIFFEEFDVELVYPAKRMLKASNSSWNQGIYLQLFPNNGLFLSKTEKQYSYKDLVSLNITGSASGAMAAVSKINLVVLNGIETPIIYIDEVRGTFLRYDNILTNIAGEVVSFGQVNGSLSGINIDTKYPEATTGNQVGDILDVVYEYGSGGKAIVTELSNDVTGEVRYNVEDGGFGYTIDNTKLLVSNQSIILDNPDLSFVVGETLRDSANNTGTVIGQNTSSVGVYMTSGEFDEARIISTVDRDTNINISPINQITPLNNSSPGTLYPDGGNANTNVIVSSLTNSTVVSVITDPVAPFVNANNVPFNSADYEAFGPMSGSASPVNSTTAIDDAFDIQDLTIGTIVDFDNINPGSDYVNDVFAIAQDDVFKNFERKNQILRFSEPGIAGNFTVGEVIRDADNLSLSGLVMSTDTEFGSITVRPYSYYGFTETETIRRPNDDDYTVTGITIDYSDPKSYGDNAIINTDTEFAVGKILAVGIENSGLGYVDTTNKVIDFNNTDTFATLNNANGIPQAAGTVIANTQGKTEGFWADYSGHINGYIASANGSVNYYESGQRIQDSDFYQEYSYQIKSTLGKEQYEKLLKENVHLAGTKMFGDFIYKSKVDDTTKARFLRLFNDDGSGSPLDIANIADLRASVTNYTADSTFVSADHEPGGTGGLTLNINSGPDLTVQKNWSQGFYDYTVTVGMPSTGTAPYPVAILLHGSGGNGAAEVANWANDLPGHIILGVDGYDNSWNISNESSNGPDIEMLEDLIDKLKLYNNVDETKIRILGTSNGGALALRAAVEINDTAVDVVACIISQTNDDQYRSGDFFYPSDHEQTGDAYANDGYDTAQLNMPQRKILQLNGRNDNTVPYNGGAFVGMNFLSAVDSAFRFAESQGYSGTQALTGTAYGSASFLADYGDVIFLNDNVGHTVSTDMRRLIQKFFENNYDITY